MVLDDVHLLDPAGLRRLGRYLQRPAAPKVVCIADAVAAERNGGLRSFLARCEAREDLLPLGQRGEELARIAAAVLAELCAARGVAPLWLTPRAAKTLGINAVQGAVYSGARHVVVITGLADPEKLTVHVSGANMTLQGKTITGSLFGSCNPQYDIVRLLRLYDEGKLKLDELVTSAYSIEEINQGYEDLRNGKNIRGVVLHT